MPGHDYKILYTALKSMGMDLFLRKNPKENEKYIILENIPVFMDLDIPDREGDVVFIFDLEGNLDKMIVE